MLCILQAFTLIPLRSKGRELLALVRPTQAKSLNISIFKQIRILSPSLQINSKLAIKHASAFLRSQGSFETAVNNGIGYFPCPEYRTAMESLSWVPNVIVGLSNVETAGDASGEPWGTPKILKGYF